MLHRYQQRTELKLLVHCNSMAIISTLSANIVPQKYQPSNSQRPLPEKLFIKLALAFIGFILEYQLPARIKCV